MNETKDKILDSMEPEKTINTEDVQRKTVSRASKPKPLVEGINTPQESTSAPAVKSPIIMTEAEKKLISEIDDNGKSVVNKTATKFTPSQKPLFAKDEPKKSSGVGLWLGWILVILALGVAGYYYVSYQKVSKEFAEYKVTQADVEKTLSNQVNQLLMGQGNLNPVIELNASSTPGSVAASSTPAQVLMQIKILSTPTGFLKIRSTPSTGGKEIGRATPGEVYEYLQLKDNWYEVRLTDGTNTTGWVSGSYVSVMK